MPTAPDPKKDQSKTSGETQKSAYPLDSYTVAPKSGDGGDDKSPFYKSAAPSVSLPKGGGALKGIDEKFTVNAVNGTAALQVPLPFTPGRGGFTPNLALQYNSGSGNSEFGMGWSLSLPAIQRKTDKKLPRYDDVNESDVFMLAGAEDLIPELTETGSPVSVTAPSPYSIKRYRPRIEGLFARIERISSSAVPGCWWKVTTKENIVTFYGLTSGARISDPEDSSRIFKWLPEISYDCKGNVQVYKYETDNDPSAAGPDVENYNRRNGLARFTNTYLSSVSWCNTTPFLVDSDYQPTIPTDPGFKMIGVLDYGNYDTSRPDIATTLPMLMGVGFSDFHACFEVRTNRICTRILMFHLFEELLDVVTSGTPPVGCLIRSLTLNFDSLAAEYSGCLLLNSVTQSGYTLQPDGSYYKRSLPPLSMHYSSVTWNNQVQNVSAADAEHAPQGLTGGYQWIDLWGEGLPGILSEQAAGWFYKSNLGEGHFTPALSVAQKPSFSGLGASMQWADLDANGKRQLVSHDPATAGYFELDDDQQWQPFRNFNEWINVDWDSPYTRVLDLDGDGRPDVLVTEETVWKWYENEGTSGYTEGGFAAAATNEEKGPRMLHNDAVQAIFLADMNGDGITDIVRIQNGEVCYWPNMGYGRFGARVTMGRAPWFDMQDAFDPKYITLADINGTGTADLIYVGKGSVTTWSNLGGNSFLSLPNIVPLPSTDVYSKITVTDFLGNGTACLVWSSPLPQHAWAPMRYIDLMGGNKPYLLTSYSNGMGKTVALTYKQSTKYYLEDKINGKPWATRLPFPVHCVEKITTTDQVSDTSYTQLYSYHHGYYDHEEREFRGFGRVEVTDTDIAYALDSGIASTADLNQAPVKTVTWYHTGAWMREATLEAAFSNEYYPTTWAELPTDPVLPAGLSPQEQREAYRALKGQPLRQEVYALDGTSDQDKPYSVATHAYAINRIQPLAANRFASFLSYPQQSLSFACERNVADPRVAHEMTIEIDTYGNITKSAKLSYPRSHVFAMTVDASLQSTMTQLLCTYTENTYTGDATTGVDYHLRLPCESKTYEIKGLTYSGALLTPAGVDGNINGVPDGTGGWTTTPAGELDFTTTYDVHTGRKKKLIGHTRTLFAAKADGAPLDFGLLDALGLPYQQYRLAFTADMLSESYWFNNGITDTAAMLGAAGGYLQENTIAQFGSTDDSKWWLPSGTVGYDTTAALSASFYTPKTFIDPWSHATTVTYWASASGTQYYLLPATVTDAVSNVSTVNAYNWYNLQPTQVTDPNHNISQVLFDALGMPVAMAARGKVGDPGDDLSGLDPEADPSAFFTDPEAAAATLLGNATWRCVYDLAASPMAVGMIGREIHTNDVAAGGTSPLLIRLTYTDGMGRVAMHKVQTEPDATGAERWIGSGKTVYNNKGKPVMQYEPFFSPNATYDAAEAAATLGVTPKIYYDALGRVVLTKLPDGSYTKTIYETWGQKIYDNNDTLSISGNSWYDAAMAATGTYAAGRIDAAQKAVKHQDTYTQTYLDPMGRAYATVQNNRYPDSPADPASTWDNHAYLTYSELHITGNLYTMFDGVPKRTATYYYNLLWQPIFHVTLSLSERVLTDVAGQSIYEWVPWRSGGIRTRNVYDAARRLTQKEVIDLPIAAGTTPTPRILEQMVYGEGMTASDTANNLRGRMYRVYDGAGLQQVNSYDFAGQALSTTRTFANIFTGRPNWASATLETNNYTTTNTFDALGRPTTITTPEGGVTSYTYDKNGLLYSVGVTGVHSLATGIIKSITYNAKGQRLKVQIQNDSTATGTVIATTTYTYDDKTFRLVNLHTTRASRSSDPSDPSNTLVQDLNYWYDPVGNITRQSDDAQQTIFFAGTVTDPVNNYTYDALYRLIMAKGRELASNAAPIDYGDSAKISTSPTDTRAMLPYTQTYTYDAVGNMKQMQHSARGTAGGSAFSNEWTRNFTHMSYPSPATPIVTNNLDTSSGTGGVVSETYTYDKRNNIVGGMNHLNAGGTSMTYNEQNRLEKVIITSTITAYYQYDSAGQRVRKVQVNTASHTATRRKYIGQWERYEEYDTATNIVSLIRETLHVSDDGSRVAVIDSELNPTSSSLTSQNVRYQFSNHLGSASLELDETGALITYEEYYPFGSTSFQMGPDADTVSRKRYRYTGKERDEGTGFYYHGARYYIPWLARWAAVDPLEAKYAPESTYCYGHNNPVRFTDSTGMGSKDKTKTSTPSPVAPSNTPMDCFQPPAPAADNVRVNPGPSPADISRVDANWQRQKEVAVNPDEVVLMPDINGHGIVASRKDAVAKVNQIQNEHDEPAGRAILGGPIASGFYLAGYLTGGADRGAQWAVNASVGDEVMMSVSRPGTLAGKVELNESLEPEVSRPIPTEPIKEAPPIDDQVASTFMGRNYTMNVSMSERILYRGGNGIYPLGEYLSTDRPQGVLQVRIDKAIPPIWPKGKISVINTGYAIRIPAGVPTFEGLVAPQGGVFLGGTNQVFIEKPWAIYGVQVLDIFHLK